MKKHWLLAVTGSFGIWLAALQAAPSPFELGPVAEPRCEIDRLVFTQLEEFGIQRAHLCSDAVFIRRVYLDCIGTLPTPKEVRSFLQNDSEGKRAELIDALLLRDEFADYWSWRWGDVLRVKSEFPINLWPNAVQAYHRWIRTALKGNLPYDRFVRELLTSSGSNFRVPQVNFYRAMQDQEPETIARTVALTFMGARAGKWEPERLAGLAKFFDRIGFKSTAEWKEEIVYFDRENEGAAPGTAPVGREALFPDGKPVWLNPDKDPRIVFADWLIRAENPWYARSLVNRVWFWLLGRGLIHEPDDICPENQPVNSELLAWLEREFANGGYDLQQLYRTILTSQVYQLASVPRSDHPEAGARFAYYSLRRLEAEVLIDALCQITGTTEEYTSPIPEPFTYIPEDQRSIELADGSITSSFLELFGRAPRDTGLLLERNNSFTASQRLHLLNSSHVQRKIEQSPKLRGLMQRQRNPRAKVSEIYLTLLSRYPTAEELRAVSTYEPGGRGAARQATIDLVWALLNSSEFLHRH